MSNIVLWIVIGVLYFCGAVASRKTLEGRKFINYPNSWKTVLSILWLPGLIAGFGLLLYDYVRDGVKLIFK